MVTLSRRGFIGTAVGGVLLSVGLRAEGRNGATERLNAWLQIGTDDRVIIQMSQSEMGQGISTTLPAALADELGADWARVETIWSPYDPAYGHPQYGWMFTGNSESSSTFFPIMRTMGAAAREMLVQAAASQLSVDPKTLGVRDGIIRHAASGRQLRFGDVAAAAAKLPVPSKPALKPATDREGAAAPRYPRQGRWVRDLRHRRARARHGLWRDPACAGARRSSQEL
jgi:isoquinoline 1-oxidoreductase subunit beta